MRRLHFVDALDDEIERVDGPLGHLVAEALVIGVKRLPIVGEHLQRLEPGPRIQLLIQVPGRIQRRPGVAITTDQAS